MINSSEGSDILVFNCYLRHLRFLLTCYVCSTKIGENSDISKCFENFVSQALGVLTRVYAAELRSNKKMSMKTSEFGNTVLSDQETLKMLQGFCYEALRFLKVSVEKFPKFAVGVAMQADGKADPLIIDYTHSKVLVYIPVFRILFSGVIDNDAPSMYRLMGYQLARFWYRFTTVGDEGAFNIMDKDSFVFAQSLMTLKGCRLSSITPVAEVLKMLKSEFKIECEHVTGIDTHAKVKLGVIRPTKSEHVRIAKHWEKLHEENINRSLISIVEGDLGSKSNPFGNVDEAAAYIAKIEQECLSTDQFRQEIAREEYFYDGQIFRISWASANVSYYPIEGASDNCFVVNQLSTHNKFVLKPSLANHKFLYRGQSRFFSPCKPSLFRENKDYFVDDIIQIKEFQCLLKTHPLVQLFERGFELLHDTFYFKINYDGLSQHYYNNTPLLDLTSDMEVAKFFAVTTFNMKLDCYEKYTGNELGVLYYFDLKADSFQYNDKRNYIVNNIGKQPFMRSGNQSGFLINIAKDEDFNNYPEVRYVFFRHNPIITDRVFAQFDNGDRIMPEEILRSHWHRRMNDEKIKKLISTEALKLNYKDNLHESHNKIIKALQNKGFKIKKYQPSFTKEELEQYYATSLKFWHEFCSNIHFYSPEGALMKEHLINLPNDPRYKWAFIK